MPPFDIVGKAQGRLPPGRQPEQEQKVDLPGIGQEYLAIADNQRSLMPLRGQGEHHLERFLPLWPSAPRGQLRAPEEEEWIIVGPTVFLILTMLFDVVEQ